MKNPSRPPRGPIKEFIAPDGSTVKAPLVPKGGKFLLPKVLQRRKDAAPSPAELTSLVAAAGRCRQELQGKRTQPSAAAAEKEDGGKAGIDNFCDVVCREKYQDGRPTGKWSVTYLVRKKHSDPSLVGESALIKKGSRVDEKFPTDVREVRRAIPFASPGQSIGVRTGNKGTFGVCLARYEPNQGGWILYALTCNHVASANGRFHGREVEYPAPGPGGFGAQYSIGQSADHQPILGNGGDMIDAALVRVYLNPAQLDPRIEGQYDFDTSWTDPTPQMRLVKFGANGKTYGRITGVGSSPIDYGSYGMGLSEVTFPHALVVTHVDSGGHFADPGDSGAIVFDADTRKPVAMVIGGHDPAGSGGGGEHETYITPIRSVIDGWSGGKIWIGKAE